MGMAMKYDRAQSIILPPSKSLRSQRKSSKRQPSSDEIESAPPMIGLGKISISVDGLIKFILQKYTRFEWIKNNAIQVAWSSKEIQAFLNAQGSVWITDRNEISPMKIDFDSFEFENNPMKKSRPNLMIKVNSGHGYIHLIFIDDRSRCWSIGLNPHIYVYIFIYP